MSLAKPRHRGPRERFVPGGYRGYQAPHNDIDCNFLFKQVTIAVTAVTADTLQGTEGAIKQYASYMQYLK